MLVPKNLVNIQFSSLFLQNHVRSVVGGVTLVAAESLKVLQDGETYSSLLEIIHRLHGKSPF